MARTHKNMGGMELLQKAWKGKKQAESSLQNLGKAIGVMMSERQKRNNQKAQDFFKRTGSYPG